MTQATTQLLQGWSHDEETADLIAPDLMQFFSEAETYLKVLAHSSSDAVSERATVEEFLEWLDSEDFGENDHIRANAWRD